MSDWEDTLRRLGQTPGRAEVIGVDPSLTSTGWAGPGVFGHIRYPKGVGGDARLASLYEQVLDELSGITHAVVEDLPTHAQGAGKSGMAHGVVRLALQVSKVPYLTVVPASLKKYATGKGNATKPDMRVALLQRTGLDLRNDDEVDAWWLRALGMDLLGRPTLKMPETHRSGLQKIDTTPWEQ